MVWDSSRGWTAANAVLMLAQSLLALAALGMLKLIIDAVTAGLGSPDTGAVFPRVALFIGLAAGIAVLGSLLSSVGSMVSEVQSGLVVDHVHDVLHAKAV